MSQTTSSTSPIAGGVPRTVRGAGLMLLAGVCFAGINTATQWSTTVDGVPSTAVTFWQYFLALLFGLPLILREGRAAMRSKHLWLHVLRAVLSAGGVQAWAYAFAQGVPIGQVVALSMTSPFFVIAGAGLFLHERITPLRIATTCLGFVGAIIILAPWSAGFSPSALLPILAAALWAATSLITKYLTRVEASGSIAVYLLLLLTPINALFWAGSGFALPLGGNAWLVILLLGILTVAAQYLLTRAYAIADAAYLQPFDDLKLPLNLVAGWIVFSQFPGVMFWPGAALIVLASLILMRTETR